jgi:Na+/melibiose symporter-like transporter
VGRVCFLAVVVVLTIAWIIHNRAPFFRWKDPSPDGYYYDEAHFIISISMYDTLFSFTTILLGSLVTDNHRLSDKERVNVLASGKVLNLVSTFVVAKIGLGIFDTDDMGQFRVFLLILAALVAVLFVVSQALTHYSIFIRWNSMRVHFLEMKKEKGPSTKTTEKLKVKQVFQDFWRHNNFWAWIWMELLLESQNSFSNAFLKTFVDRLLHDEGMSRENCDWLLSASGPLGLVLGIFCYIPIRKMGYKQVYPALFLFNFFLSLAMVLGANHQSSYAITVFLVIYPAITSAVASTGFHLAMSDMVLEMKKTHALDGRFDEPSLAGLFIGVNALFCKPAESMLPVIAANRLENFSLTAEDDENVQKVLFKLLVMPPLLFSCIQYLSWRRYSLTPAKTSQMRDNLRHLEHEISQRSLENGDELLPTHTTNPND